MRSHLWRFLCLTTVATSVVVVDAVPLASSEKDASNYWEEQARVRATLITKDTFKHAREKKSGLASLPAPFVVSTSLNVNNRGRSSSQTRATSTRSARSGFNAAKLSRAKEIIVEGIRVPDDESDRVTHRNGRFINNVFVPDGAVAPPETTVIAGIGNSRTPKVLDSSIEEKPQLVLKPSRRARKAKSYNRQWSAIPKESQRREGLAYGGGSLSYGGYDFQGAGGEGLYENPKSLPIESRQDEFDSFGTSGESRDYSYHAGQTKAGRPVYYIVEDSVEDLHSDRSPYHFEPADSHTSFSSAVSDYTQAGTAGAQTSGGQVGGLAGLLGGAGSSQADSSDFVIKEHTYTMCPGCPSFSIPIPIPKSNLKKKANTLTKGAGPAGYPAYDGGKVDYQSTTNKTFLEKIGDRVVTTWNAGFKKMMAPLKPLLGEEPLALPKNPLAGFFGGNEETGSEDIDDNSVDASNILEEKVSTDNDILDENEEKQEGGGLFDSLGNTPLLMGGLAAAGLGAFVLVENLALLATNNGDSQVIDSRSLRTNAHQYGGMAEEEQDAILKSIQRSEDKFLKGGRKQSLEPI